ncbi:enoyl-CoA hydratase/isomerase family protein [Sporosarcina thermotolerans]|uniref:Ethylmalonyl-CoA decarboxylase n=1 Tax=Sporosarcina thermotolerans TaxID=633404 RepID=A0AAW9A3U2_9BACL|nr:enoyl-CoA hydratase/isomerase family protein [Sporosarcina thermotolerans]MDW0115831.1 enoyl-CoA hydratase/isomerase family protein [Sporosarcina thermotolerans]WHT49911.1 enoyl-CoA hydratase/isomerase family protein [Sporosarcina thermotolerans]
MAYKIKINDGVATFTINRPEMRNAINFEVMDGLEKFLGIVENDEKIAFAVITGSGDRAFCSGGDLSEFHGFRTAIEAYPMLSRMASLLFRLSTLPMPVIALVNGAAVGGGCEIASACDYRVVSSKARAGFIQGTLAITSGWGGATQLFTKMKNHDAVLKFLTEAKIHNAEELKSIGWATSIYDDTAEIGLHEFISTMKDIHPDVHRAYKKISIQNWKNTEIENRMLEEAEQCAKLWESEAHHKAVESFLRKK